MSGRTRSKPNRGGGRFNKPQGRAGGGARKAAGGSWDEVDDFSLDLGCSRPVKSTSTKSSRGGRSQGFSRKHDTEEDRRSRPERMQLPLQKIHMTSENKLQVKELLRELQNQEYLTTNSGSDNEIDEEEEDKEYDELDHREEGQFWITHDDGDECPSKEDWMLLDPVEEKQEKPEPEVSLFALGSLCRYGFDRERCRQALESGEGRGDVGVTFELLLTQMLTERFGSNCLSLQASNPPSQEECVALRQEEAFALTAIYGERFCERIRGRVWTVQLDLMLLDAIRGKNSGSGNAKKGSGSKQICKFYLKGSGCRFGSRCRFKHQTQESKTQNVLKGSQPGFSSSEDPVYKLEIRFQTGSLYPFQPPLVAFSSTDGSLSGAGHLSVTEHLFSQALSAAREGEPVVYTLVSSLEEDGALTGLLSTAHHKYSAPPPVLAPPTVTAASSRSQTTTTHGNVRSGAIREQPVKANEITNHRVRRKEAVASFTREDVGDADKDGEEEEGACVPVETESYVELRKRARMKTEINVENTQQENKNLNTVSEGFSVCFSETSGRYVSMQEQRQKLPAWQKRNDILDCLQTNQALVISGMTGCGKTTQIPQFILDQFLQAGKPDRVANIICTQPRRISAITVANRVAQERAEALGRSTGYQIRLETIRSSSTRLMFCTTGVLLRRLEGDPELSGTTHVIVDEVHERTEESDFLLLVLKDLIVKRTDLRIIMMSATLNAELFSQYFNNCPSIHIPGRTFPVEQFFLEDAIAKTRYVIEDGSPYLRSTKQKCSTGQAGVTGKGRAPVEAFDDEDGWSFTSFTKKDSVKDSVPDQQLNLQELSVRYTMKTLASMDLDKINMDLVERLLEWIVDGDLNYPPGAVLVFLPGLAEIKQLYEQLQCNRMFNNRRTNRCVLYPLHSSLSSEDQQAVFTRPPEGVTKIIISTNIAETSVTIDDVVYVVDSGRMKEKRYDGSRGMESLEDVWVSRANALQRKGRAGRVASGVCFHLFTRHRFSHHLIQQQLPEIQRVPLEQLCLRVKVLEVFAESRLDSVFSQLIEPPAEGSLEAAKRCLCALGALTEEESLTPLGWHLACLPVDVRIGKLMLLGAIFRCLDPALTIAASLAFRSPFVSPWDKREEANEKKMAFSLANSDHLALLQAYKGWCKAAQSGFKAGYQYCRENFLSIRGLQEISCLKRQFAELLSDIGFVTDGLKARNIEKLSSTGSDGVLEATGYEANLNSENTKLMSAMLCAALYPNVVQVKSPQGKYKLTSKGAVKMLPKAEELRFMTKSDGTVHIHPSSVNFSVIHSYIL
ncbi:hypothetical protein DNTS_032212 [Danionella cerebrum]|uniref:Putative ATP-dependent RNA helicase DHX57 n=1 Tax=Danionella cerebrum TaxID=2873325 RepID=A0A553N5S4_9TELE|nr:hypothetical protein DNTS_032212 [Danionella translucida]